MWGFLFHLINIKLIQVINNDYRMYMNLWIVLWYGLLLLFFKWNSFIISISPIYSIHPSSLFSCPFIPYVLLLNVKRISFSKRNLEFGNRLLNFEPLKWSLCWKFFRNECSCWNHARFFTISNLLLWRCWWNLCHEWRLWFANNKIIIRIMCEWVSKKCFGE